MKKLVLILIAFATIQVSAQEQKKELRKQRTEIKKDYSPEDMAQLQTKKMTLHLDLTDAQQKEVEKVLLEEAKLRKSKKAEFAKMKAKDEKSALTKEQRVELANKRLDHQIEMKKKMKTILSAEQFEKWEKMSAKRGDKQKKMMRHNKTKQ